jgi:hypothetical protein
VDGGLAMGSAPAFTIASVCSTECSWGSDWSCLGKVDWPQGTLGPVTLDVQVVDGLSLGSLAGATVTLCSSAADYPCDPNSNPTNTTGPDGIAPLARPSIINALQTYYVLVQAPGYFPGLWFAFPPLSEQRVTFAIPVFNAAELNGLSGPPIDYDAGGILVIEHDCRGGLAPGVTFSLAPPGASQVVYWLQSQASLDASATSANGQAAVYNVPPLPVRPLTLTATPPDAGQPASSMQLFVPPGGIAVVYGQPTP